MEMPVFLWDSKSTYWAAQIKQLYTLIFSATTTLLTYLLETVEISDLQPIICAQIVNQHRDHSTMYESFEE